jgi:hypothetical protein
VVAVARRTPELEEDTMFVSGIDPHPDSHTPAVLDEHEQLVDELRLTPMATDASGCSPSPNSFTRRVWAIEGAPSRLASAGR